MHSVIILAGNHGTFGLKDLRVFEVPGAHGLPPKPDAEAVAPGSDL